MANQYYIERVVVDGTDIGGHESFGLDPGIQAVLRAGGSEVDPTIRVIERQIPVARMTTVDVGVFLGIVWGSSELIPHAAGTVDIYLQRQDPNGLRGGSSTAIKLSNAGALIVPTRISGRRAQMEYEIRTLGLWTISTGQTVPAGGPGASAVWGLLAVQDNTTPAYRTDELSLDFNINVADDLPSNLLGSVDHAVLGWAPSASWRTRDLAVALGNSGFAGTAAGAAGLKLFLAQWLDNGVGFSASGAYAFVMRAGSFYFPRTLSGQRGQIASVTYGCRAKGADDMTNSSMTLAASQSMPTESATQGKQFACGDIRDNSTPIEYERFDLDFGIRNISDEDIPAARLWHIHDGIVERAPSARITTMDAEYVAGLGASGRAINTAFSVYLRNVAANTLPQTSGAVLVQMAEGRIEPGSLSGQHGQLLAPEILVTATKGGGAMLTLNTSATHP